MVQNPDIQKKAQKAIDDVVGHDRLPDFTDSIPYVDAIVKEVNRWRPVLPLSADRWVHLSICILLMLCHVGSWTPQSDGRRCNRWLSYPETFTHCWKCMVKLFSDFDPPISHPLRRAMLNDKEIYPEPHVFRPERFLKDGKLDPNVRDPVVAFGFGR